jgi:SAM-dependent methyltransferase
MILAPGTILQRMYVKERLKKRRPGTFIEVGVGQGLLSSALLDLGWTGFGLEVDAAAANTARLNNASAIETGRYSVLEADWIGASSLDASIPAGVDLIISSMVLEHLNDEGEQEYFARCAKHLTPRGVCIALVPASMRAWGIEDDIAGHHRRYSFSRFEEMLPRLGWRLDHVAGLTFPLSNVLLPISNWLVARSESEKRRLDMAARTRASGRRKVYFKTVFPQFAGAILNEAVMYPFHLLQKAFLRSQHALVIYVECVPLPHNQ